jgi:hypothetical protein
VIAKVGDVIPNADENSLPLVLTRRGRYWRRYLRPRGFGTLAVEPFDEWWARVRAQIPALLPEVYEQWIHRHWDYSPYYGLPLTHLQARSIALSTEQILAEVGRIPGSLADPPTSALESFYDFLNNGGLGNLEPMKSMNRSGTWELPILVIRSEDGFEVEGHQYSSPTWLIEGHQRMRYLKVLANRSTAAGSHALLELSYRRRSKALRSRP